MHCHFYRTLTHPPTLLSLHPEPQITYGTNENAQREPQNFNFNNAQGGIVGDCATVTYILYGFAPSSINGAKAPNTGGQKICKTTTYTYTAIFGPYKNGACSNNAFVVSGELCSEDRGYRQCRACSPELLVGP